MSDEKALLAAIWEHPHEDTPRLVYADWLQENGQPERAEFIRLQCELAQLSADSDRFRVASEGVNRLLKKWGTKWKASLPRKCRTGQWSRGFFQPDDRGIEWDKLLKMPTAELLAAPTRSFSVLDTVQRFDEVLAWPFLDRLNTLHLREQLPTGKWLPRVLACRGLRNVCRMQFIDSSVTATELEALLTAWQDRRFDEISLNGSKVGDAGFRVLLNHPLLTGVRELGVSDIGLTAIGIRSLAESRYHPPEPELALDFNPIGDEGIAELVRWPGLARITTLRLDYAEISNAGASALAGCQQLHALQRLFLHNNRIGVAGAKAVANSPYLRKLSYLTLGDNPLCDNPQAVRALKDRFGEVVNL